MARAQKYEDRVTEIARQKWAALTLEGNDDANLTTVLLLVFKLHAVERAVRSDSLVRRKFNTGLKAGTVTRLWTAVHAPAPSTAPARRGVEEPTQFASDGAKTRDGQFIR